MVDYLIELKDYKGNPAVYVTDYQIVSDDGTTVKVKAKGYRYEKINDKFGWVPFNDFKDNKIHRYPKSAFKNGTTRRKVYSI